MKIAVTARIRSGLPFKFRQESGLSQRQCAELAGVSPNAWCAVECMKFDSVGRESVKKIAEYIGCCVEDLVPEELRGVNAGVSATRYADLAPSHLLELSKSPAMMLPAPEPSPEEVADQNAMRERLERVMDTLTYREREIIKLRYGVGTDGYTYTYEECGKIFKITRERVRQIEARAIRKLKHPVRAKRLEVSDHEENCRRQFTIRHVCGSVSETHVTCSRCGCRALVGVVETGLKIGEEFAVCAVQSNSTWWRANRMPMTWWQNCRSRLTPARGAV